MTLKVEVTVKCINIYDNTCVYSCDAIYSASGNTLMQSEVDDHTKAMASNALYMTHTLLRSQIKDDEMTKARIDQYGYDM